MLRSNPPLSMAELLVAIGPWLRILAGGLAHGFLDLADAFLDFALDLLTGVPGGGACDVVGFAFDLFDFAGGYIFTGHEELLKKNNDRWVNRQSMCRLMAAPAFTLALRGG